MIPVAGAVRLGDSRVHGFRLAIPFLLLWVVLFPLLLLVTPILFLASLCVRINPFRTVGCLFQILAAVKGTHVEVENQHFSVLVNIF